MNRPSPYMASQSSYQPTAPPLQPLLQESSTAQGKLQGQSQSLPPFEPPPLYPSLQHYPYPSTTTHQPYGPVQSPEPFPAFGFPVPQHLPPQWSSRLCDCFAHPSICVLGCFCPCVLFGKIAEQLDDGMTSCGTACIVWYLLQQFTTCGWIYSWGYRSKLRSRHNLPQRPLPDCLVHCCCWCCAFCQEYRELRIRRLREEASWDRRGVMVPPPLQTMYTLN